MPWHVIKSDKCPESKPWGVVNPESGDVRGCHPDRASAMKQMAVLYIKLKNGEIKASTEHPVDETMEDYEMDSETWEECMAALTQSGSGE